MLSLVFFFKQNTSYEMRISDWSSDVCSSDLVGDRRHLRFEACMTGQIERKFGVDVGERPAGAAHRAIMLGEPLERLPRQIESSEERRGGKECGSTFRFRW